MIKYIDIDYLKGKVLKDITLNEKRSILIFILENNDRVLMHHDQDCCETVELQEIHGDIQDLVGSKIIEAYESSGGISEDDDEHMTWTFYIISTIKGYVTLRWLGSSNGYYSESVDVQLITDGDTDMDKYISRMLGESE